MTVARICNRIIATASPNESIRSAARRMAEYDVGSLIVLKEETRGSRAVGVITDRDVTVRCVAQNLNPDEGLVSDIMATAVHTVPNETSIEDALAQMASNGTRRLVVTADGERPAGVLTLDDVLAVLARDAAAVGRLIEKQQPTVPV